MTRSLALNRDNLADAVSREIQHMILGGEAQPGDWLMPQPELARRLGVGLSTVREAINGLSLLGILEPQPGRGTWITADALFLLRLLDLLRTQLADLDVVNIYEARRLLEIELTALAAQNATDADIARIEAALARMRQTLDDDAAFMQADLEFHLAVAEAGGNPLLKQFYHITAELMGEVNERIAGLPGLKSSGLAIQEGILEAIRAHNPALARRRALALVKRWHTILRAFVGSEA